MTMAMTRATIEVVMALYWLGFIAWNLWLWKSNPEEQSEAEPASAVDIDKDLGDPHAKHSQ